MVTFAGKEIGDLTGFKGAPVDPDVINVTWKPMWIACNIITNVHVRQHVIGASIFDKAGMKLTAAGKYAVDINAVSAGSIGCSHEMVPAGGNKGGHRVERMNAGMPRVILGKVDYTAGVKFQVWAPSTGTWLAALFHEGPMLAQGVIGLWPDPKGPRVGKRLGDWVSDSQVIIDAVEVVGSIESAESVCGQLGTEGLSMKAVAAFVIRTSIERVVRRQSVGQERQVLWQRSWKATR